MDITDLVTVQRPIARKALYQQLSRPKKKDSCVQVSEVKKIRVGRSKNIFILDFFFITNVQRL